MALTAVTVSDIIGQTQTITFSDPAQVDQIIYSGNQIHFQPISSYNLSKSELPLYFQYLNAYNLLLFRNFPSVNSSINGAFPLSVFDISLNNVGTKKIIYNQTSGPHTVLNIDYLPVIESAAFAARNSVVTITLQEFFMTIYMLTQYAVQVSLN